MPEQEYTHRLRTLAQQWGASLFGVADLRTLSKEVFLISPSILDRYPLAVAAGYHLSDAILEDIEDHPTPLYFHHYQRINILLDSIGLLLTEAIQGLGSRAVPIAASQLVDWKNQRGHLSHKHVARAAGLGWIGRNNLLVNGRYGSRIRLVTVMTDLPLVTNAPSKEDCGSCRACLAVCPAGAIAERQADFDHHRCYEQLKVFSKTLHLRHQICGICVKACRGRDRKNTSGKME